MIRGFVQLLSLVRPYSGHLLRVLALQLSILLFTIPQPWLIKHLIDKGTVYENYPVAATIAVLILLIVLTGILFFLAEYSLVVIANTICYHLRRGFYGHVQSMSYSFFDRWRVGDLFARYKEVSVVLPQVLVGVGAALGDCLAVLVYGGLIIYINPPISMMILVAAAASLALMVPLARLLHRSIRARARQIGKVSGIIIEFLGGMKVIQALRAEAVSEARLARALEDLKHHEIRSGLLRLILLAANRVMVSVLVIVCIWYALGMVQREELTLGTLTAVLALLSYLGLSVRRLLELLGRVQIAMVDLERYVEIVGMPPAIVSAEGALPTQRVQGRIELKNLHFGYNGNRVLEGVSVDIQPGEKVAIVGASGAGKTTLANLIPRFYELQEGSIALDGQDIRTLTLESLREQIAVVPQDPFIFSGTVQENIAFGKPDAPLDEIIEAAKAANIHERVVQMPKGYQTQVGERGYQLSGGEKQRITIARALIFDRPILILDEATSYLDVENEERVQQALARLMAGRTTLIIAHRLSTVRSADKIMVLKDRRIVECGRHEELMRLNGQYAHLIERFVRQAENA